jgi:dTDP-4-dehydrorhamnose 3,5-epimerase
MIDGVILTRLAIIEGDGGRVMHGLKITDPGFNGFNEAYFSEIGPMKIKAWKRHKKMTLNLIVPIGEIRFVLFDDRLPKENSFQEINLSLKHYYRLTIPPMVWLGFQGRSKASSVLLNVADLQHDPEEVDRKDVSEIQFDWSI